LNAFLRDFLHRGRDEVDELDVVIIDRQTPDIELEALFKRYYTKLQYFIGSVMNIVDLQRIQVL
jgi:potassium large conductance calcium-activated channel subfamily M alpha protein 1